MQKDKKKFKAPEKESKEERTKIKRPNTSVQLLEDILKAHCPNLEKQLELKR